MSKPWDKIAHVIQRLEESRDQELIARLSDYFHEVTVDEEERSWAFVLLQTRTTTPKSLSSRSIHQLPASPRVPFHL